MRRVVRHSGILRGMKDRGFEEQTGIIDFGFAPLPFLTQGKDRKNGGGTTLSSLPQEGISEFRTKPTDVRWCSFGSRSPGARLLSFASFDGKGVRSALAGCPLLRPPCSHIDQVQFCSLGSRKKVSGFRVQALARSRSRVARTSGLGRMSDLARRWAISSRTIWQRSE